MQGAREGGGVEAFRAAEQGAVGALAGRRRVVVDRRRAAELGADVRQVDAQEVERALAAGGDRLAQRLQLADDLRYLQRVGAGLQVGVDAAEQHRHHLVGRQRRLRLRVLQEDEREFHRMLGAVQHLMVGDVAAGAPRPLLDHAAGGLCLPERRRVVLVGGDREAGVRLRAAVMGDPQDHVQLDRLRIARRLRQRREGRRVGIAADPQIDVRAHDSGQRTARAGCRVRCRRLPGRRGDRDLGIGEAPVEHRRQFARIFRIRPAGQPSRSYRRSGELAGHGRGALGGYPVVQEAPGAQHAQQPLDVRRADVVSGQLLAQHAAHLIEGAPAVEMGQHQHPGDAQHQRPGRDLQRVAHVERQSALALDRDYVDVTDAGERGARGAQGLSNSAADTPTCTMRG